MHSTNDNCKALHEWARALPRHTFPFDEAMIPKNGLYLLFEKGERAHGGERIVRVGTHTGQDQLPSRLHQHFVMENKDRSIFRKNIGRALLQKVHDPYAAVWELDFTPALSRKKNGHLLKPAKQKKIEAKMTNYMQTNFSFAVVEIEDKAKRLEL